MEDSSDLFSSASESNLVFEDPNDPSYDSSSGTRRQPKIHRVPKPFRSVSPGGTETAKPLPSQAPSIPYRIKGEEVIDISLDD